MAGSIGDLSADNERYLTSPWFTETPEIRLDTLFLPVTIHEYFIVWPLHHIGK